LLKAQKGRPGPVQSLLSLAPSLPQRIRGCHSRGGAVEMLESVLSIRSDMCNP
jgi:hypothetical protein